VLGVVAAVVALAIVAFVVMSGGNDDADEAAIATTAPATGDQADEADDTGEADEADEADDGDQAVATDAPATTPQATATTTADTTERAATNVAVCATDASTVTDLATSNDGMLVAVDGSLRLVDGDAVASCGFDPIAAPPVPGIEPSGVVTWVSATDGAAALSSIDGGSVERRGIGRATCDGLNGPTAMTANDRVLVITGEGGVTALAVDFDGCTATTVVEPTDLVATSIAAVGAKGAVLGTDAASGEAVLRLFAQGEGSDVVTPDGLGSADAVTGCGGGWCVIDVANDRIVLVADNGSVAGERTLSAGLPAAVTRVVAATKGGDSIYAVVELADGSTPLVRLTP
jgi:hypothetical protein